MQGFTINCYQLGNTEERTTLPTIDWNDEQEVRLLTAKELKPFLRQQCLPVSEEKEVLINRWSSRGEESSETKGNGGTASDPQLLFSSDSEHDLEVDESDSLEMGSYRTCLRGVICTRCRSGVHYSM